jgi:hypothetical protein
VPSDEPYSSRQFHASVEIELSDALSAEQLQERIHATFATVKNTVEAEINGKEAPTIAASDTTRANGGGNGHDRAALGANGSDKATNAQIKYLTSLASQRDLRLSGLNALCQERYQVESIYDLTKKQASELVDGLKNKKLRLPT